MLDIGFLRVNKRAFFRFSNYFTGIFYVSPGFGIRTILFAPEDVDFSANTIRGTILQNGKPEEVITEIPPIVDNSILDGTYSYFMAQMDLRTYMIRHSLKTSKMKTYDMLQKDGKFSDLLIPTTAIKNLEDITAPLSSSNGVIIKHANSSGGKSIIKISASASASSSKLSGGG